MLDWHVANTVMTSDTFCSSYCHGCNGSVTPRSVWTTKLRDDCVASIETVANVCAGAQNRASPNFTRLASFGLDIGVSCDSLSTALSYRTRFWGWIP